MTDTPNVIDRIKLLHRQLVENPAYNRYIVAKNDAEAVEGDMIYDSHMAADMIRKTAQTAGDWQVAQLQLATIVEVIEPLIGRLVDPAARAAQDRESREARLAYRRARGLPDPKPRRPH